MPSRPSPGGKPVPGKPAVAPAGFPPPEPPRRRWLVWTRRLAILLVVLAVLGVAGFTWFAYWPLEASYARPIEDLVPVDVDFLYRTSWKDLKATGWVQHNVVESPLHPAIASLREQASSAVAQIERRVNESIPGAVKPLMGVAYGTTSFGVEKDVFPGEVVAAGRFCGGTNPWKDGPPKWREILLLTRVSGPVKFFLASLKHEFFRKMAVPAGEVAVYPDPSGAWRFESSTIRVSDTRARSGCEGAQVIPPENVWYVARVRDVLAVSNSDDLIAKAVALGRDEGERAVDSAGWQGRAVAGGIAASFHLPALRSYLNNGIVVADTASANAGVGEVAFGSFVSRFVTVNSLLDLHASLVPEGIDGLHAPAELQYEPHALHPAVADAYRLEPTRLAEGIAMRVPEKDTFAVLHMRSQPRPVFQALWETLPPGDRHAIEGFVREKGRYKDPGEFLDELAAQLGTEIGVAGVRPSAVMDAAKYMSWFPEAGEPSPIVGVCVMVRIAPGKTQDDVDKFLADRVGALGFPKAPETEIVDGVRMSRIPMDKTTGDYKDYHPAYCAFEGYLLVSTEFDYLKHVLKVMRGEERSVAQSDRFRHVMRGLPGEATLAVYADAEEFHKVLWDHRQEWVRKNHPADRFANETRAELQRKARQEGRTTDMVAINDEVDRRVAEWQKANYLQFVEDYRKSLLGWDRYAGFGLVLKSVKGGATLSGQLEGGASILLKGSSP
jgi:hypothetical protein